MNRSEAAEEAILEWIRRRIEGDRGHITGLNERLDDRTRLLERTTRLAAETILEALRFQFPALKDLSGEELRRRAEEGLRREGWGR